MANLQKPEQKTFMVVDVFNAKTSEYVYLTDTRGSKIYFMVRDIPQIIKKLEDIYKEAKKYGKT